MYSQSNDAPKARTTFLSWIGRWLSSRRLSMLAHGVPALIILFLLMGALIARSVRQGRTTMRYITASRQAINDNDFAAARMYLTKLDDLGSGDEENVRYNLAMVELATGDQQSAETRIEALAPTDAVGYGPAHLWTAKKILTGRPAWQSNEARLLIHHLESALKADPELAEAHLILSKLYADAKDYQGAVEHLEQVVETKPEFRMALADLYRQLGNDQSADKQFRLASEHFRQFLVTRPEDFTTRVKLAQSYFKVDEFENAERVLREGLQKDKDNSQVIAALSSLCLDQANKLRSKYGNDDPRLSESLTLLGRSLSYMPTNTQALNMLTRYIDAKGETGEKANRALKKILAQGKATATIHMILGTRALTQNELPKAKLHFNQAYKLDPKMPATLNNIAWMMSHQEPPNLERALEFVNKALELVSDDSPLAPSILDTRGQIYVSMQRWEDALTDLEAALPRMQSKQAIHKNLATVYEQLGDKELAENHRSLAGE